MRLMYSALKTALFLTGMLSLLACSSENNTSSGSNSDTEFLTVDEAFNYSVEAVDQGTIKASWKIAEGYHLYKDKMKFEVMSGSAKINHINYPPTVMLDDKIFGKQESFKGNIEVIITLTNSTPENNQISLKVGYQGCAAKGLCYPPEKKVSELVLKSI